MAATGKGIDAAAVIDKYSGKLPRMYSITVPVVQNVNGVKIKVNKHLPLEAAGVSIVNDSFIADAKKIKKGIVVASSIATHQKAFAGAKLRMLYKTAKGAKVKAMKDLGNVEYDTLMEIFGSGKLELKEGSISTEKVPARVRLKFKKEILEKALDNLIEKEQYDDELLRPFLDFNYEMSKEKFQVVFKKCGLTFTQWSEVLGLTMDRIKSSRAFNHQQSMHILKILLLFNHSYVVFNDKAYFKRWLKKKSPDLGGTPPYFYLDSPSGIDVIRKRMHRIEHGIYS